jgi:toll-interacting protein
MPFALPEEVISKGMVVDEWYPLSGQEGHDKEGMIHIILSLQPLSQPPGGGYTSTVQMMPGQTQAVIAVPSNQAQPGKNQEGQQPVVRQQRPPPKLSDEQLEEFGKMFPNIDKDVISSVFQENQGNQDSTINSLLLLSGS